MGLAADSSVATWLGALALIGSAIASAAFANTYCRAFEENPKSPKSQNDAYYTAQYVRVLGSLTAGFAFLYVVWVFVDSRHPAKAKLWKFDAKRLQVARIQAKKSHMQKLAALEGILAVAWIPPVFILMFKGWVYRRHSTNNTRAHTICSSKTVQNCEALKNVGGAAIATMVIVILLFVVTLLPCTAKPKPKTAEELKKEEEEKKKKEVEEDRVAENRYRRMLGLPELSAEEYGKMKAGKADAPQPLTLAQMTGLLPPGQAPLPGHPGYPGYPGYPVGFGGYSYGMGMGGPMPYGYGAPAAAAAAPQPQPQTIVVGGAAGGGGGTTGNGCGGGNNGGGDLISSLSGLRNLLQPQQAHRRRGLVVHAKRPGYYRVPAYPNMNRASRGVRQVPTPTPSAAGGRVPSEYSSHQSGVSVRSYGSQR